MINLVVSGEYQGCQIKHTRTHLYIKSKGFPPLFLNANTINKFEVLYTDTQRRFSVIIKYKNKKSSILEINKKNYLLLVKTLSE